MELTLRPATLPEIDRLDGDTLALDLLVEERPPRGLAGLVDWRLNGLVSRWLTEGDFDPAGEDPLLFGGSPRLGTQRLFLLPLGQRSDLLTRRLPRICDNFADLLARSGARRIASAVPGAQIDGVADEQAVETWLAALSVHLPKVELTLLLPERLTALAARLARSSGWYVQD